MSTEATLDLYLGPSTSDVELQNGDLRLVAGVDAIAQGLRVAMRLFYGEWFLTPDEGIPYWRDVLVSAPKSRLIESLFRREILKDEQIESIKTFSFSRSAATRRATITFTAISSEGVVAVSEVFP